MDVKLPILSSIKITAGPAVFECGDCYAVVWATSAKGSGKVIVDVNGAEKVFWDAKGGDIKTHDKVHVVKIPKETLIGNTYRVFSQRVNYKWGYDSFIGNAVSGEKIRFKGQPKSDNINILCVSDVHDRSKEMYQSLEFFKSEPDMLALIGDISSEVEYKSRYIKGILVHAGNITKGEIPVVYARGNHETRGEFASQMINYLPTSTGEFYYTFNFGELSAIVLDPGEDKEDSHPEYSGLVDFESYRKQQYEWLLSLKREDFPGKYLIVFSHVPRLHKHFGMDWNEPLKTLDADLIIGGHYHISAFDNSEPPVYVECGKRAKTDEFAAGAVTLDGQKIKMLTINNKGETLLNKTIEI